MEALKARQYTIKNTPIPESAKRFDGSIPWVSINMSDMRYINRRVLEALKPMGRMDGDMATNSVDAASAAQTWRRECELLRKENADIKAQAKSIVGELEAQVELKRANIKRLTEEIERLQAENDRLRMAARDETPRSLSEHSRESRPITCRLRIHGFISSHPVDTTIEF
jgi:DNA anti-recombination protein RmuC